MTVTSRSLCVAVCVVAAGCAWTSSAFADRVVLDGQFVEESPGVPNPADCKLDLADLTLAQCAFVAGTATLTGTWRGQNLTAGTATIDLETGATAGTYEETFTGFSDHRGFGTVMSEGNFEFGALDPSTGAQSFRAAARIVGGSGDFAASRGHITYTGSLVGAVGTGSYHGTWIVGGHERQRR
jgi:hypothetical protein